MNLVNKISLWCGGAIIAAEVLTGCEEPQFVEVCYVVANDMKETVRVETRGLSGDRSVEVEPGERGELCTVSGIRGLYMIYRQFDECRISIGGEEQVKYESCKGEGFFDVNRWEDYIESLPAGARGVWRDTCTYRVSEEELRIGNEECAIGN